MSKNNNFEVENEEIKQKLREKAKAVFSDLPKGWGFTLFLFEYGKDGSMFWISSAQREDMINALFEFITKQKGGEN